jgi:hypothetical protein
MPENEAIHRPVWSSTIFSALVAMVVAGSVAVNAKGGGGTGCFIDLPSSACTAYQDGTPTCPDVLHGGGQCGNPVPSSTGFRDANPTNPTCFVQLNLPNGEGCQLQTQILSATVSCKIASGPACP